MSKILNEYRLNIYGGFGIGRYSNRNLKSAEKKFIKADNKYVKTENQIKLDNKRDNIATATSGQQHQLDAKLGAAKESAKKYDEVDKAIKERKDKKNNKIADKLINKEKFARKFDYSKMTPELKSIYNNKLEERKKYLSTGQGPTGDTRSRVDQRLAEEDNKFLHLYDNFPILNESYNPAELKESYTHEDFAELILESVVNAESLDTFQLLVLAESLGYEYLEEGKKWDKIKRSPITDTVKKGVAGGLVTLAAIAGSKGFNDYNTARDLKANLAANTQEIRTTNADINKLKDIELQGYRAGLPVEDTKRESERLQSTVKELESKRQGLASNKAKADKEVTKHATHTTVAGGSGLALGAYAVMSDKKKKKELEEYEKGKNKQIDELQGKLKEKQEAEAKKNKK